MSGHTPGPWAISKYSGGAAHELDIETPGKGWFLRISAGYPYQEFPDPVEVKREFEANAALIAAAPETAAELERVRADIAELVEKADAALNAIDCLIAESDGVAGLHLNGDLALWSELTVDGHGEEWLMDLEPLRAALAKHARAETSDDD